MSLKQEPAKTRLCKVLSTEDPQGGGRIQVRLRPEDDDIKNDADLPWCFPLLPKMIHSIPQEKETAIIIIPDSPKANRFFIGPVISQDYFMAKDMYDYQSRVFLGMGNIAKPLPNPSTDTENDGSCLDATDIALRGRKNTDVILKEDNDSKASEVRIRCGYKSYPGGAPQDTLKFNREDLGYILMRYKKSKDHKNKDYSSSVNIVADRINLLSHDSNDVFALGDSKSLITDETMKLILENAHPLVYGDNLVDVLKRIVEIFLNHRHSMHNNPPSLNDTDQIFLTETNFDKILLSTSVRTN